MVRHSKRKHAVSKQPSQPPSAARPFIKWVGGKTQLLPAILARIPKFSGTYFEPFLGGGAVFFALSPKKARLSDVNAELVNCYRVIKKNPTPLVRALKPFRYERTQYYQVRDADRLPAFQRWSDARRAARLIYLNKCGFNGLYRVNSKGFFNVPFGRYDRPTIVDSDNLRACSRVLRKAKVSLASFLEVEKHAKRGDFVYFDPPYAPLSATASFTSYARGGFDAAMQVALAALCKRLHKRGVKFLLSNSSAPLILKLYRGFTVELIPARRSINSKGTKRGAVNEVLVRNYK